MKKDDVSNQIIKDKEENNKEKNNKEENKNDEMTLNDLDELYSKYLMDDIDFLSQSSNDDIETKMNKMINLMKKERKNNNINNNNINNNNDNNKNNLNNNPKELTEDELSSYNMISQKFSEFLQNKYGSFIPKFSNIELAQNHRILIDLSKNRIPIEDQNFINRLECSNDLKEFLLYSLENFKLTQVKEKIQNVLDKNNNIHTSNNNYNNDGLIHIEDDDFYNSINNDALEPMELDKSMHSSMIFRKSFLFSIQNSDSNINLLSLFNKNDPKTKKSRGSLFMPEPPKLQLEPLEPQSDSSNLSMEN